jgi:hypothetical protein
MGNNIESEELQEKLSMLAIKIDDKNFDDKPEYSNISTYYLFDDNCLNILEKLSNITKY